MNLNSRVCFDAIDEVAGHTPAEVRTANDKACGTAAVSKKNNRLASGVAATNDDHRRAGALSRFHFGSRVIHAGTLESLEAVKSKPSVARACGRDDCPACHISTIAEAQYQVPILLTQRRNGAWARQVGAKLLSLDDRPLGQIAARNASGKAEIIL